MASSRTNNPWWQGGNDEDLKRNPYAQEDDELHDDIMSTASSMYIETDTEEVPMSQTLYESDRRTKVEAELLTDNSSRERYSKLLQDSSDGRRHSSSEFGGRMQSIGVSKPSSESALNGGRSGKERERITSYRHSSKNSDRPQTFNSRPSSGAPSPSSSSPATRSSGNKQTAKHVTNDSRENRRSTRNENKMTHNSEVNRNRRGGPTHSKPRVSGSARTAPIPSSTKQAADGKNIQMPRKTSRTSSTGENTLCTTSTESSSNNNHGRTTYSMSELIKSLATDENSNVDLPPSLERRIQDFRFAQNKRREKHGDQKPWGIYGLYAHLSDIRADLEWAEDAAWRRHRGQPYLSWRDFDNSRDQGLHSRPLFTWALMGLCTIMMFVTLGVNGWTFEAIKTNPLIGPSFETLLRLGARDTNLIVNEGQWFRLFTPMVLHAGLVHYFVNMLALYFIGGAVEKAHGAASAGVLFVIPAVGGNILSAICLPGFISVGASGGIFGLIGMCMADICLNWNLLFPKTTTDEDTRWRHFYVLLWLAVDIIINCLIGFTPFVDNFTHMGGFVYGFCIGIASIERLASTFFGIRATDKSKSSYLAGIVLRFFGLIVSVIAIMATTIVLVNSDGVTSPCHGCRYISCVPFPPNADEKWWYCDDCDIVTADIFQSIDGSGLYEQVNLNCPNGVVEEIPLDDMGIYDKEELRQLMPTMCRNNCDQVFG